MTTVKIFRFEDEWVKAQPVADWAKRVLKREFQESGDKGSKGAKEEGPSKAPGKSKGRPFLFFAGFHIQKDHHPQVIIGGNEAVQNRHQGQPNQAVVYRQLKEEIFS